VLRGGAEGVVEVGAEGFGEGSPEELIHPDAFAAAFLEGAAADVPAVQVEG